MDTVCAATRSTPVFPGQVVRSRANCTKAGLRTVTQDTTPKAWAWRARRRGITVSAPARTRRLAEIFKMETNRRDALF